MQESEILQKLQELGFKEYESRIFLVLLKGSCLSATEIAKKAKIHRTAVYDILKKFAQKGYCNEIETNTILKYEIIDPKIILYKIEEDFQNENREKISKLKDTFKDLQPLFKSDHDKDADTSVNIELIRGFNRQRHTKFIELFKQAKKEIFFMIRLEGQITDEMDEMAIKFFEKGGVVKSIYEASLKFKIIRNDNNFKSEVTLDDLIELCEGYEKGGENVKISTMEIPNMTIFDREIVFINIEDKNVPRHNRSDIIIKNEEFAHRMIDLFDSYWEKAFTTSELKKIYNNKDSKSFTVK
ncbi:MAG: TrmB family transcriptional regulator [Ignavibacteriae bacterium]|nr:TrmB family transcriptional regulator [Ignavibacteriota bacterium]MCB0724680.1 TrmB family transcriptional regulator [Ignavibacteriota bacterium]MCB9242307.1 TrmB family transcriptional regulator [Ignavibacteriales bacterium]